jgi:hypothetical protein
MRAPERWQRCLFATRRVPFSVVDPVDDAASKS